MPATNKHATTFTTPSDTDVVVTRTFDAPRKLLCGDVPRVIAWNEASALARGLGAFNT